MVQLVKNNYIFLLSSLCIVIYNIFNDILIVNKQNILQFKIYKIQIYLQQPLIAMIQGFLFYKIYYSHLLKLYIC